MTKRRVANPLALAVLACLTERPMHPYEMAATMRQRGKHESIKLNYGSLYSVIEALKRHDLIEPEATVRAGNRPERTVYRLTEAGRLELTDWLDTLLSEPAKEYTQFEAGLSLMPALTPGEAVAGLERRCARLEMELARSRSMKDYVAELNLPRLFVIEEEYRTTLREAELAFVRRLKRDIETGALEGTAQWRRWSARRTDWGEPGVQGPVMVSEARGRKK